MRRRASLSALVPLWLSAVSGATAGCSNCPSTTEVVNLPLPDASAPDSRVDPCSSVCKYASPPPSGQELFTCRSISGGTQTECHFGTDCATGRRPTGFRAVPQGGSESPLGAQLARNAVLEAASVYAFSDLARELAIRRAPARFVRACRRAARDERRHAATMRWLARRFGVRNLASPRVAPSPLHRSVEAFAIENAVEGCVRETFGAVLAAYQARHARNELIRQRMQGIARDELRHAELAWAIDRWVSRQLPAASKSRVVVARDAAVSQLTNQPWSVEPEVGRELGLPAAADMRRLVESVRRDLWLAGGPAVGRAATGIARATRR